MRNRRGRIIGGLTKITEPFVIRAERPHRIEPLPPLRLRSPDLGDSLRWSMRGAGLQRTATTSWDPAWTRSLGFETGELTFEPRELTFEPRLRATAFPQTIHEMAHFSPDAFSFHLSSDSWFDDRMGVGSDPHGRLRLR